MLLSLPLEPAYLCPVGITAYKADLLGRFLQMMEILN